MKLTPEQIVDLAKAVEIEDAVDWGELHVDKDAIYNVAALFICEKYNNWADSPEKDAIIIATVVKLVVENFALNLIINKY